MLWPAAHAAVVAKSKYEDRDIRLQAPGCRLQAGFRRWSRLQAGPLAGRTPPRAAAWQACSLEPGVRIYLKTSGISGIAIPSCRGSEAPKWTPSGRDENRLAPAELVAAGAFDFQLVPQCRQRRAGGFGHERFDLHVAAGEGSLREPAGLQRLLRGQAEVGDVGHELRVRLRLVPSAHDPEGDPRAVLLHESRDDRVERPLARSQRVRVVRLEREQRATVLQHEAGAIRDDAGSEPGVVALDERHHVAVAIRSSSGRWCRSLARW